MEEALLGFTTSVTHLDGHEVLIKKTGVTKPGLREKIKGEGMPEHEYSSNHGVRQKINILFYFYYRIYM